MIARAARKPGAPSKQTPDRAQRILEVLRAGGPRRAACGAAGISEDTFARWLERSADFADAVIRAEADSELELVRYIRNAGG
jgi:DNA invertase Pin-like site-specific DNA recombinase